METRRERRLRMRHRRTRALVGALAGAPFDPTAPYGDDAALVPEQYEQIDVVTYDDDDDAHLSPRDRRFWNRRPPMSQRHGRGLLWGVLAVLYVYLGLFALVVLLSLLGN